MKGALPTGFEPATPGLEVRCSIQAELREHIYELNFLFIRLSFYDDYIYKFDNMFFEMNILFICKHNRFRSKVAEAIFNKYNKNSEIKARSAGIKLDMARLYVADNVKKILQQKSISVNDDIKVVNLETLKWADKIIIVGDNINKEELPKEKIMDIWKIQDCDESEYDVIKLRVNEIENRILEMIKKLKK